MDIAILIFIIVLILIYIFINVNYNKYSKIETKKNMSGFEVAREIIDSYDLNSIYITESREELYCTYDYKRKIIKLIKGVFSDNSLTSCAIAAMVATYAIRDKSNDKFLIFKKQLEQFVSILIYIGYIIIIIGSIFVHIKTVWLGFGIEMLVVLYHLLTYFVEKKAKEMAMIELINHKIINAKEKKRIAKILNASSLICVASVVFPIAELLKRIYEFGKSD